MSLQQSGGLFRVYPTFTQQPRDPERDSADSEDGWMDE